MSIQLFTRTNTYSTFDNWQIRLNKLYHAMYDQGLLPIFFYDSPWILQDDFIDFCSSKERYIYLYTVDDKPASLAVLSSFTGKAAISHFCFLKDGLEERHYIAQHWLNAVCNPNGLSCVMGLTPKPYRHAINFALEMGYQKIATVPDACRMFKHGKPVYVDGIFTSYQYNING